MNQQSLATALDDHIALAADLGFSGAALVAVEGEVVLEKGYGLADRDRGRPVAADTVFDIGSITKQFTAAAILKLATDGQLSPDDPLSRHLEGVPADKAGVTLHHLLTHTAGLADPDADDYDEAYRDETVRALLEAPLVSEPGESYAYSNAGYSLLAVVLEHVSGQGYEAFLRERLLEPAGLRDTGYRLPAWDRDRLARGYDGDTDHGTPLDHPWAPDGPYWHLRGNGGLLSTVSDLYRWHLALEGEALLPEAAKTRLYQPFLNHYAYGWLVRETPHGKLIEHNGASSYGFNAEFRRFVDRGVVIAVTCNQGDRRESPTGLLLGKTLTRLVFSTERPAVPARRPAARSGSLEAGSGSYRLPSGDRFDVQASGSRFIVLPAGQDAVDALAPAGAEEARRDLNARAAAIVEGLALGNARALEEALANPARLSVFRRFLENAGARADRESAPVEVLGTLPTWWDEDEALATFVRLGHGPEAAVVQLYWKDGRLVAAGRGYPSSPAATAFWPRGDGEFVGYHLGLQREVSARLDATDDERATLTIRTPGGEVVAHRA